jgi:NhaP-type Na+/H+ and K+/H+ antiporter
MLLGFAEPQQTALLLAVLGILVALSVLFSRVIDRLGLPIVLLFLVLGMLGGSEGIGGIEFDNYHFAVQIGTAYLVLILFDGGMSTSPAAVRRVLLPATTLATVGITATALLVAAFARLLGFPWSQSLLLGAVVSSTDAAAVFAVLRGGQLHLQPRVGQTLEVESCVNDPMAVILTVTMIEAFLTPGTLSWMVLAEILFQLLAGGLAGAGLGYLGRYSAYALSGDVLSFFVDPSLAVCGAKLSEIQFPPNASVILVVRGTELMAARGNTVLMPGDHVYVFAQPADLPYIELLFGTPERDVGQSALGR